MFRKVLFVLAIFAVSLSGVIPVFAQSSDPVGAVYLMTNSPSGNAVVAYNRFADGSLALLGSFATGGLGSGLGVTVPPDPLGSQHSIIVTPNGKWVLAVNAGSNEISSFRVTSNGLRLADKVGSGGDYPVSLTYSHGLVYVLNAAGDGSISGFNLESDGGLAPITGSTRSLDAATPADGAQPQILEAPAQIGFSPNGDFLLVTDKGGVSGKGRIDVFSISDGLPSASPTMTQTTDPVPFSFAFDKAGHPVVVDASTGSVTSYDIGDQGALSALDVTATGQKATCWIAGSPNGRFLYTDNTGSGTISGFQTSRSGDLTALGSKSVVVTTGSSTLPLDVAISQDGSFLYSLETGAGTIGVFQVQDNGSLSSLGTVGSYPAVGGFQGIAAR
jgi:6-phosphogluconolactonase (cycloisomerase 2 family)